MNLSISCERKRNYNYRNEIVFINGGFCDLADSATWRISQLGGFCTVNHYEIFCKILLLMCTFLLIIQLNDKPTQKIFLSNQFETESIHLSKKEKIMPSIRLSDSFISITDYQDSETTEILSPESVNNRIQQYQKIVQNRFQPDLNHENLHWPLKNLTFIILKYEKKLEVWSQSVVQKHLLKIYPICGMSGNLGPKLQEGDMQVPEGIYQIPLVNPNSRYHLSVRINYPNQYDLQKAKEEKRSNLGGDIMIHGGASSKGCIAIGDKAAEDIFILSALAKPQNCSIIISPYDFRNPPFMQPEIKNTTPWINELYQNIQNVLIPYKMTNIN